MKIIVDLGSVWEFLSAVGTVGATVVALSLAVRDISKRLFILFIWDAIEYYCPVIVLTNTGSIPIAIKSISFRYQNKEVFRNEVLSDFSSDSYAKYLIKGGETKKIKLDPNSFCFPMQSKPYRNSCRIKIIIEDMCGKKFIRTQKLTVEKLQEVIFGAALFDNT